MERVPEQLLPVELPAAPRATRLSLVHRPDVDVEIWMGGTQSLLGEDIDAEALSDAIVVDCSGELGEPYRSRAGRYVPRVFLDVETVPAAYPRIAALVHELAERVSEDSKPDALRPRRIYVLCQQGMNRSGLVAGLLLRALGEEPQQALSLIREVRPGALSNETFAGLVERWVCPEAGADS
jgi:hypothetical protein